MTTALKDYVGHPPDAMPSAGRPAARDLPYTVYCSGDGWEVVAWKEAPKRVLGWHPSLPEADWQALRLNALPPSERPEAGRFVVTRHARPGSPTVYELIDAETGRRHYSGDSARAALAEADRLARGQAPTADGRDDDATPEEAHAALDAMLADAASRCDCQSPHHVDEPTGRSRPFTPGTFADTDAAFVGAGPGPSGRTLADDLEIEADLLIETGAIGPNARLVLAGLFRQSAEMARLVDARTIDQFLQRAGAPA